MAEKFPALDNYKEWRTLRKADPESIFGDHLDDLVEETTVGMLLDYKRLSQDDAEDREQVAGELEDFERYLAFVQGYRSALLDLAPEDGCPE